MAEIIAVQGYAGAGKTTHSEYVRLHHMYKGLPIEHVSIGSRLRAIRTGKEASRYAGLISDFEARPLTDEVVTNVVFEKIDQISDGLVLVDGYPREKSGVSTLVEAMHQGNHQLLGSLWLQVTREASITRLLARGRREGENLRENSLEEEAERRYRRDGPRIEAAMRRLGEIASVQVVDVNVGIEEARERFITAAGQLGAVFDDTYDGIAEIKNSA